jgi:hypothetical protein
MPSGQKKTELNRRKTMEIYTTLEAALFSMVRQRIIYLGGAVGKSPQELNVETYRQMQNMLGNEDFSDAARELAIAKKIAEVYG